MQGSEHSEQAYIDTLQWLFIEVALAELYGSHLQAAGRLAAMSKGRSALT
jgi:hypothetical protein